MTQLTQDSPILTVSQLTQAIKHCLENTFPTVWIQGEISNFTKHTSGHLYFSLKDADAQVNAVMFRGNAQLLQKIPREGDHVMAYGSLNVYPPSGKYQITIQEIRFVGIGNLLLKLEELKQKLHKKGWFKKERKKMLPKFPQKIGVVTSPTGAVIQDILNILSRRYSNFHLILNPVKVQGEGAAEEIAQAIRQFNQHHLVDVMIVGRGGGSIEDLWAFNEEKVAEAIYESTIPIICAVGHETDHCIAEYVADMRAPTPSAAAELVIAEKTHHLDVLNQTKQRLSHMLTQTVRRTRQRFNSLLRQPVLRSPYFLLGSAMQRIDDLKGKIDLTIQQKLRHCQLSLEARQRLLSSLKPKTKMIHFHHRLLSLSGHIDKTIKQKLSSKKERLYFVVSSLKTINPKNLLEKGYSIVFDEKGEHVITSIQSLKEQERLQLLLSDGKIITTINQITPS